MVKHHLSNCTLNSSHVVPIVMLLKLQINMMNLNPMRSVCVRHTLDRSSIKTDYIHTSSMLCSKVGKRRKVSIRNNILVKSV